LGKTSKILHFEGIRGICALLVFVVHFWPTTGIVIEELYLVPNVSFFNRFLNEFPRFLFDGDLPVYIFWLMSGHVITIKYFRSSGIERSNYLKSAALGRAFRLFVPVFFSSLIAFVLLKVGGFYNQSELAHLPAQSQVWLHHWYDFDPSVFHFFKTTIIDVFLNENCIYNPPLWTISIELFGSYLCYAVLSLFGNHQSSQRLYLVICSILVLGGTMSTTNLYYLAFILGIMYSQLTVDPAYKLTRSFMILGSVYFPFLLVCISFLAPPLLEILQPDINENVFYFFRTVLRSIGLLLFLTNLKAIRAILSWKPFVVLGKISFGFYLLHFIVLLSLGSYLVEYQLLDNGFIFVITLLVTLIGSYIFQYLVDAPSIRISKSITQKL
jgi:peptidoglycan/LPS O-acetylase OafA/YrhL